MRLNVELRYSTSAHFLTFTYEDGKVPVSEDGEMELRKKDFQLLMKRIRKHAHKYTIQQIRYYAVGEYGTKTDRPHYHAIMFNLPKQTLNYLPEIWQSGHVHYGEVNEASIHYTTKYVVNRFEPGKSTRQKPFSLMSRRPGLGIEYAHRNGHFHRNNSTFSLDALGGSGAIPRYLRDKIFTREQKSLISKENALKSQLAYLDELDDIKKNGYHSNPWAYYMEKRQYKEARIKNKINQTETL